MNIKQVRLLQFILISIMIAGGKWNFLWYTMAMHVSIEILNSNSVYLRQKYKLYNFIFSAYGWVLLERLRVPHFSDQAEWIINCVEHLLFGIVICINVYIYTAVISRTNLLSRWKRGLIAFCLFNIIGLFNEVFQNNMTGRKLFILIPDSLKDIEMNLLGSTVFILAVLFKMVSLQKINSLKQKFMQAAVSIFHFNKF